MTKNTDTAIEKLIAIYGSANKTSQALGCTRQIVDMWRKKGRMPYRWGKTIEAITQGQVTAIEIWEQADT